MSALAWLALAGWTLFAFMVGLWCTVVPLLHKDVDTLRTRLAQAGADRLGLLVALAQRGIAVDEVSLDDLDAASTPADIEWRQS